MTTKTTPTVTIAVWNYCDYGCPYCVAGSNTSQEAKHARVEWTPLTKWLSMYRPGCNVHLAGGEPLLRDDINEGVEQLISAGHNVAILTNGARIKKHTVLLGFPIVWIATHHPGSVSIEQFLKNIEPIRKLPHIIRSMVTKDSNPADRADTAARFSGWNFNFQHDRRPQARADFIPNSGDHDIASGIINLIEPDGTVYPCNAPKFKPIGNIYEMTMDESKAHDIDRVAMGCVIRNKCSAYQTAVEVDRIING